jgi:hypothetical protein
MLFAVAAGARLASVAASGRLVRLPCLLLLLFTGAAPAEHSEHYSAAAIAAGGLTVVTAAGEGTLPVQVSADWMHRLPEVARALVVVPDAPRDADLTQRIAQAALFAAGEAGRGTMIVVPRFLGGPDAAAHAVSGDVLRWSGTGWIDGEAAIGPAALSSFDALDAVLARFADPTIFPNVHRLVLAGHGAGAQLVQRYAVVGRGMAALAGAGVAVRYVVANPSSYLWLGDDRPVPTSRTACATADRWPYGLAGAPAYVEPTEDLEERYIARDVVYLLGEDDTDPNHPLLDRTCAAQTQGPTRYVRGMNYLFTLEQRHPNLVRHRILSIWGVGHDAGSMFVSACGLAALFDRPGCAAF